MSVLAWRKSAPAMSSFDPEDDDAEESPFFAGERICPPPAETRGNSAMRICVVILIAAGGWWLFRNPESWQRWLSTTIATSSALMEYKAPSPVAPAMAPPDHTSPAEPAPRTDTALTLSHTPSKIAAAVDTTPPPSKPVATVTTHPALKEFSVSPLQPPATDQTDPYRARAVAAGLHPDLSRVPLVAAVDDGLPQCAHRHRRRHGEDTRYWDLRLAAAAPAGACTFPGPLRARRRTRLPEVRGDGN